MVERHPYKVDVAGSNPSPPTICKSLWCNGSTSVSKTVGRGSSPWRFANVKVAERPNARVCKTLKPSVRIRPFTPYAGVAQLVEHYLAKVDVASSNLVSRSKVLCLCSLMVKQRIYIPCATDNWPMWVRLPPEAPIYAPVAQNTR